MHREKQTTKTLARHCHDGHVTFPALVFCGKHVALGVYPSTHVCPFGPQQKSRSQENKKSSVQWKSDDDRGHPVTVKSVDPCHVAASSAADFSHTDRTSVTSVSSREKEGSLGSVGIQHVRAKRTPVASASPNPRPPLPLPSPSPRRFLARTCK